VGTQVVCAGGDDQRQPFRSSTERRQSSCRATWILQAIAEKLAREDTWRNSMLYILQAGQLATTAKSAEVHQAASGRLLSELPYSRPYPLTLKNSRRWVAVWTACRLASVPPTCLLTRKKCIAKSVLFPMFFVPGRPISLIIRYGVTISGQTAAKPKPRIVPRPRYDFGANG
jgi:hypothetical protein